MTFDVMSCTTIGGLIFENLKKNGNYDCTDIVVYYYH